MGRNYHHVQLIDVVKLSRLRVCCTCHACQFFIHAEKVLEGDGGKGLIFLSNPDSFLGLHSLMKAVAPPSSGHHAACKFIHNDNLIILDHIVHILFKQPVRPYELLGGMKQLGCAHKSILKFLKPFLFILLTQALIFLYEPAFHVQIGNDKISQAA